MIIEKKKLSDLIPAPYNPRQSTEKQEKQLKASLEKFGVVEPIIFNKQTGYIVGGHFRVRELKKIGYKEVECVIVDLSPEDERELNIRLNANTGDWDWEELANNWEAEKLEEWGLDVPDFKVEPEAEEDDYEVPETITTDIVPGDLFEIGDHRLLCGDSTNADDVARLMNGSPISKISVLTDPPYGIKWNGNYKRFTKNGKADSTTNYDDIKNDDQDFDPNQFYEYDECIIWGANIFSNKLDRGSWLIWDKRTVDGFSFLADAEIAWEKGSKYGCYIKSINQQSEKSKTKDIRHPTKKPIELMSWCIERLNKTSIIYDAYSGSGSTMVAAHQLGRKCYGMDLDPKYCQVIVDRMRKLDPSLEIKRNGEPYKID